MAGKFRTFAAAAASLAMMAGPPVVHAQPAPPPPAAEAPIDPGQLALAKHLMSLLSGQMNFGAVMKSINASMLDAVRKQNPNVDPAVFTRLQAAIDNVEAQMMPDLMNDIAAAYARHLTRKEMEDSITFYESPSGQSILHKMPEVMQDFGPMMVRYIPRMQKAVLQTLCDQNACTPEQRLALAGAPGQAAPR